MYVTFGSSLTGDVGPTLGPYPFVQLTYNDLRVGDDFGDANTVAWKRDTVDLWVLHSDLSEWTDVTIHQEKGA